MDKNLSVLTMGVLAAKLLNQCGREKVHRLVERRTLQAYGNGKGVPLTGNAEGEEIVNSYMKV